MSDVIDLQTFVAQTLIQIVRVVAEAAGELGGNNDVINPDFHSMANQKTEGLFLTTSAERFAQMVDFDVAITATDTKSKDGGAKLSVVAAQIGGSGKSESQQQSVSRVKFAVPVALPKYSE